jgi:hypothetical protein
LSLRRWDTASASESFPKSILDSTGQDEKRNYFDRGTIKKASTLDHSLI